MIRTTRNDKQIFVRSFNTASDMNVMSQLVKRYFSTSLLSNLHYGQEESKSGRIVCKTQKLKT